MPLTPDELAEMSAVAADIERLFEAAGVPLDPRSPVIGMVIRMGRVFLPLPDQGRRDG